MAIKTKEQTAEETQHEKQETSEKRENLESDLSSDIAKTLDLPTDKEEEEEEKEESSEEKEEEEESEDSEEEESEEKADEAEEEEEDDLIPRSKVDKRFAKLTAAIKARDDKIDSLENQANESKDPEIQKLEAMSQEQLERTIDNIEASKFDAIADGDKGKHQQLVTLGRNANRILREAPMKFEAKQSALYKKAAAEIESDEDIPDVTKAAPEIMDIAKEIYGSSKSLQKEETGQAEALHLATRHWKEMNKLSVGKSEVRDQKRATNKLKKKTSLAGKTLSGDIGKKALRKTKEKAHSSDAGFEDKVSYAREAGILGDLSKYDRRK